MKKEVYDDGMQSVSKENQVAVKNFLKEDDDGYYYIDYLSHWNELSETHKNRIEKWISTHIDINDKSLCPIWIQEESGE